MTLKVIETIARISAEDKTGSTFAQVAQKLRQMEDRAAGASKKLAATQSRSDGQGRRTKGRARVWADLGRLNGCNRDHRRRIHQGACGCNRRAGS